MIQELIELLAKHDPQYPSKIKGASDEEVFRLAELVGRELPSPYRAFLRHMGRSMGDFQVPDTDFSIATVLDFYEPDGRPPQTRYLFIAAHEEDAYLDYYLDLDSEPAFAVIRCETGKDPLIPQNTHLSFPSFKDLLFSFGFLFKRMTALPHQNLLFPSARKKSSSKHSSEEAVSTIERIALQLGFQSLPHTSPDFLLLDRENAAIYVSNSSRVGRTFKVAADDKAELTRICEIIRDHTVLE